MTEADSRPLRLEVTSVTVGLLHKISRADVLNCGIEQRLIEDQEKWFHRDDSPMLAFGEKWQDRYGKTKHAWEHNPWCWTFRIRKLS